MPSLTPIVPNRMPTNPAASTPSVTRVGELIEVHIAWVSLVPIADDSDLGLAHVGFGQAGGVEHRLRTALRFRLRDA